MKMMPPPKDHLTGEQRRGFFAGTLTADELQTIDLHLQLCAECQDCLREERTTMTTSLRHISAPDSRRSRASSHLTTEQKQQYIDNEMRDTERSQTVEHLEMCEHCRADIAELYAFRNMISGSPTFMPASQPDAEPNLAPITRVEKNSQAWLLPYTSVGVTAFTVATLVWFFAVVPTRENVTQLQNERRALLAHRDSSINGYATKVKEYQEKLRTEEEATRRLKGQLAVLQKSKQDQLGRLAQKEAKLKLAQVALVRAETEKKKIREQVDFMRQQIARQQDKPQRIAEHDSLHVALTNPEAAAVRNALSQTGTLPAFVSPNTSRGRAPSAYGPPSVPAGAFGPVTPVNTREISTRPTFTWNPAPGATTYQVSIFGLNNRQFAQSDLLNGIRWTANVDLPREQPLTWIVVAKDTNGKLLSDTSSKPVFEIVSPDEARRFARTQLELGILYVRQGFYDAAETALSTAASTSPDSEIRVRATRLRSELRKMR